MLECSARNSANGGLSAPDNGGVQHSLLPPDRFRFCPASVCEHRGRRPAFGKAQISRCSTTPLVDSHPTAFAGWFHRGLHQRTSRQCNCCDARRRLRCRPGFFLPNEGVHLVHFNDVQRLLRWQWRGGELVNVGFHPQHDRDMIHAQMPGNAPKAQPVGGEFHGVLAQRFGIAIVLRSWGIASLTLATLIALTSRIILALFALFRAGVTVGTFAHPSTLTQLPSFHHSLKSCTV